MPQRTLEPVVIEEGLHPVPVVFCSLFGLLAAGCVLGAATTGETGFMVAGAFFFALLGFFVWHGLPVRISLDERSVTFRRKLRTQHVEWKEIAGLSTGLEAEGFAGWVTLKLTHAASGHRGGAVQVSVPAVETCPQQELARLVRERWVAAGGSGETQTLVEDLRETTTDLLKLGRAIDQAMRFETVDPLAPPVPFRVELVGEPTRVLVITDGDDPVALFPTLWNAGLAQAREQRFNPLFGGALEFVLTTEHTPVLEKQMEKLVTQLAEELERVGLRTLSDERISVTWR
jgi:hypothetical protein